MISTGGLGPTKDDITKDALRELSGSSGYRKDECCVVENAPLRVRSGKAAGLFTIAVNTGLLPDELLAAEGADLIFPDMHALIRKLKSSE